MKKQKNTFSTWGFTLSVLGVAVGLGSIWGFPKNMAEFGGTFLIPFTIILLMCGMPILWIEMVLGNKYRKNHVLIFEELAASKGRFFGYLQSSVVWLMSIFYSVLVSWSILTLFMSFLPNSFTPDYFKNKILNFTNNNPRSFTQLGSIKMGALFAVLISWIIVFVIINQDITKGIDKANKIFIPSLFVILLSLMIYTFTLPGANLGLQTMFKFNINDLGKIKIWTQAFSQAFFMLSTCTGAIIIFSSNAVLNQNNFRQTSIITIGTTIVGLIASCTVFNIIGIIAASNTKNESVATIIKNTEASFLVFNVLPQVFAIIAIQTNIPILGNFLAILFFLGIFFAGISSLLGMAETTINPIIHDLKINRHKIAAIIITINAIISILFTFNNSSALFPGIIIWCGAIWQMIIGIIELIGVAWWWKCYDDIAKFNNQNSLIKLDKFWIRGLCLFVIPLIIVINLTITIYALFFGKDYMEKNAFIYLTGAIIAGVGALGFAFILTFLTRKNALPKVKITPIKNLL